jgi:hypothetical protein
VEHGNRHVAFDPASLKGGFIYFVLRDPLLICGGAVYN